MAQSLYNVEDNENLVVQLVPLKQKKLRIKKQNFQTRLEYDAEHRQNMFVTI